MPLFKFHGPYQLHFPFLKHKHGTGLTVAPGDVVELDKAPDVPGFSEEKTEAPATSAPAVSTPPPATATAPAKSASPDIPTTKKDS